uniref:Cupin type-1 domain-containing protein n=1 Tax=Chenopodium quinoa TaxID=63459 RepID=A0A803L997_CHEQI
MENMSLVPLELPQKLTDGEGGSYYAWNDVVFPFLGAGQIGYVLQGSNGVAGIMYPESKEEKVVKLEKGDTIVVPKGVVSWWFNAGNDELNIIYLGETHNAINPGNFTYGLLAGAIGILKGFSNKTIAKAYDINDEQVNELVGSQKEALILKLEQGLTMPKPSNYDLTIEFDEVKPDFQVKNGGSIRFLTSEKQSTLEGIKICGRLLKLDPNAMFGPIYYAQESGVELSYVTKGSGWVQIVGLNGQIALDTKLEVGQLFAVPKFHVIAVGAGDEGIECFSIVTTSKPRLAQIAGNMSFWKTMSPQVLQASLNVTPKFCELFMDKIENTTIIMPPN